MNTDGGNCLQQGPTPSLYPPLSSSQTILVHILDRIILRSDGLQKCPPFRPRIVSCPICQMADLLLRHIRSDFRLPRSRTSRSSIQYSLYPRYNPGHLPIAREPVRMARDEGHPDLSRNGFPVLIRSELPKEFARSDAPNIGLA